LEHTELKRKHFAAEVLHNFLLKKTSRVGNHKLKPKNYHLTHLNHFLYEICWQVLAT